MSLPFRIETFNAYKSAVAAALSPLAGAAALGIEVRLNSVRRHADIVVFAVDSTAIDCDELRRSAVVLPERFDELAGFSTSVQVQQAEGGGPLVYRGCPVWARAGTQWRIASDLKKIIEAAAVERGNAQPSERV